MSFLDDIQGKNTQLYPIVTIEPPNEGNHNEMFPQVIRISTNDVVLPYIHSQFQINQIIPDIKLNYHFKPLLLNIPSIKESIDIESRNFKISNVSLNVSNYLYDGQRFSDSLVETSLINWKVSIQFVSPTAKHFSTIFDLGNLLQDGDTGSWYDLYKNDEDYAPLMAKMVFQGVIRKISHDNDVLNIQVEDVTEKKAHKDLPKNSPESQHKDKIIPIVYGRVDKSPAVLTINTNSEMSVIADTDDTVDVQGVNPLMIYNDVYATAPQNAKSPKTGNNMFNELNEEEDGISISKNSDNDARQYDIYGNSVTLNTNSGDGTGAAVSFDYIVVTQIARKPEYINALYGFRSSIFEEDEDIKYMSVKHDKDSLVYENGNLQNAAELDIGAGFTNKDMTDKNDFPIYIRGVAAREVMLVPNYYSIWGGDGLGDPNTYLDPIVYGATWGETDSEELDEARCGASIKFPINELGKFSHAYIHGIVRVGVWGGAFFNDTTRDFYLRIGGGAYDNEKIYFNGESALGAFPYNTSPQDYTLTTEENVYDGTDSTNLNGLSNDGNTYNSTLGENDFFEDLVKEDSASKVLLYVRLYNSNGNNIRGGIANVQMEIEELYVEHIDLVQGLDKQKYYLDVNGRVENEVMLENPIDIIRNLVVNEIMHDRINEDDYQRARDAHDNWEFAFTIHKKTNSKKLIEEIAKSTKCFPKFRNDGSFGFNTIKDTYTVSNIVDGVEKGDYNNAHLIKESEVISYKFKKSKPEQIYKKVDLKYNKDYGADEYFDSITPIETGLESVNGGDTIFTDDYYGIEDSNDTHLEFESEFIRDEDTAIKLGNFLSNQYRNDHLIFEIKLPLQYINLEIGDLVKFRDLFQGVKAYGIDYRRISSPNNNDQQYYYPLFMVTSINKNLDSISISCMQLHHLSLESELDNSWLEGTEEGETEGLFYFPDSDPINIIQFVEPELLEEDFELTGNSVETYNCYVLRQEAGFAQSDFYLINENTDEFNFQDYGADNENPIFTFFGYIQVKTPTNAFIARIGAINEGSLFDSAGNIVASGGEQRVQLYPTSGLSNEEIDEWISVVENFYKPEEWQDGDSLPIIKITRLTQQAGQSSDRFNIIDAVKIVNHILLGENSSSSLDDRQQITTDVNEDGKVDILDVVTLVNMIMEN